MDIQSILKKMGYVDSEVVFSGEESIEEAGLKSKIQEALYKAHN
jgi:hypothetical protein